MNDQLIVVVMNRNGLHIFYELSLKVIIIRTIDERNCEDFSRRTIKRKTRKGNFLLKWPHRTSLIDEARKETEAKFNEGSFNEEVKII